MNRRGFLARLFAAPVVALAVLRAPVKPIDWIPAPLPAAEPLGISIRYIKSFDVAFAEHVNRFDVLYGTSELIPQFAVRTTDAPWWSPRRWFT